MIDPAAALAFSMFDNKGVYAVLLGSGVSRAADIPTGWEIVGALTRRLAVIETGQEPDDWEHWYRARFDGEPSYAKLLDLVAPNRDGRRALLHQFIDPEPVDADAERRGPTKAHHAIARLVVDGYVRVIITTNFDRLMEQALVQAGVEPTVLKSDDDINGARPLIHTRCTILKVHGDYLDTRLRNTEDELAGYSPEQDQLLDRILADHGLIIAGWSGDWDQALRAAIIRTPDRRFATYWTTRRTPSGAALDLMTSRQAVQVTVEDADTFFTGLVARLQAQADLNRPHPLTADLLVAAAKRYLTRPEHRIQLADLVAAELKEAKARAVRAALGPQGPSDYDEMRRQIRAYEAAYEPLARVFFVLGRYGQGDEAQLATEALQRLGAARHSPGDELQDLASYPAVLVLYAYGLGLVAANRRDLVRRWWLTPLLRERRHETPTALDNLFLWDWENIGHNALWRHVNPKARTLTELSDHLFSVFGAWLKDGVPTPEDLAVVFDTFEAYGALVWMTQNASIDTLTEGLQAPPGEPMRVPAGRLARSASRHAAVIQALAGPATREATLAAGFSNGDPEHLDLAMQNFQRVLTYLSRRSF